MRTRLIVVAVFLLLVGVGVVAGTYFYDQGKRDLIAEGVKVNNVPIGGLTRAQAEQKLSASLLKPLDRPIKVSYQDHTYTLTQKAAAIGINIKGSVDKAWKTSQEGSMFSRSWRNVRNEQVDTELAADVTYNKPAIDKLVKRVRTVAGAQGQGRDAGPQQGPGRADHVPDRRAREVQHAGQGRRDDAADAERDGPGEGPHDDRAAQGLDRSSWPRSIRRC